MKWNKYLIAWEGSTIRGGNGGVLHKHNTQTTDFGVESGVMEVAKINSDVKDFDKVVVQALGVGVK